MTINYFKLIFPLFLASVLINLASCSTQKKQEREIIKVELLTDSILNPYVYFSEVEVSPTNNTLLKNIQSLSENKSINSISPEERLRKKIELSKLCQEVNISDCNYTPEGYKILTNKNSILNIIYGYNQYMNYDEYFKYAVFNLENGERITYQKMFNNAETILKMYNDKYVSEIESYLTELNKDDEEELDEYETYKSHLDTRSPFQLDDLNNFEIVYDSTKTKVIKLKFHYNGQAGIYRSIFPPSYEEFNIEELNPYLKEEFKKLILN